MGDYLIDEGFLLKGSKFCVPHTSTRDRLIREYHDGGFVAHLGRDKITIASEEKLFWPQLRTEFSKYVEKCPICQSTKGIYSLNLKYWFLFSSS